MKFFDWLGKKVSKDGKTDFVVLGEMQELAIQSLAYEICVQRIAKAIAKCEFRVFKKHKANRDPTYYRLNVRPNPNQSGTEFWQEFIEKLYKDQEVLLVELNHDLYLADSFQASDDVTRPKVFSHVSIGKLNLNRTFTAEEAAYFRLPNQRVKNLLDKTLSSYTDLIGTAISSYRNSVGMKAKLKVARHQQAMDDDYKAKLRKSIKEFMSETNGCFMEFEGYDFQPFDTSRKGTLQTSRDIKAMLDDVLEITSKSFLIPSNIATGEVTDTSKAVDDFLTFCLDPIIALIEDGLNHVLFGEKEYLAGTKIKINAQTIKHIDIFDVSASIDKLISCGVATINDILRYIGEEEIDEDWANVRWITKNYISVDGLISTEGGAEDG